MGISTRELEEDEVKVDNLLNKILHSSKLIEALNFQLYTIKDLKLIDRDYIVERAKKIDLLIKTIINLAMLADDIEVVDESITDDLEDELKTHINNAISHIKSITSYLGKEKDNQQQN
jgi:hypothetical protein